MMHRIEGALGRAEINIAKYLRALPKRKRAALMRCRANDRGITQIIRISSVMTLTMAESSERVPFNIAKGKNEETPAFRTIYAPVYNKSLPVDRFVFPATVAQFSKALAVTRGDV